jgi:hypothetical protein
VSDEIELRPLDEAGFDDFATLTSCQQDGGCWCAFWHQKWSSLDEWKARQRDAPEQNRQVMLDRVRGGFHPGVLAYRGGALLAWIAVAPIVEVYWAWRRVAQLGADADGVAGIVCITAVPDQRGTGLLPHLLRALMPYGRARGWRVVEGYPFDVPAIQKHGAAFSWAGHPKSFAAAGFARAGDHWLSKPGFERSVYRASTAAAD